MPDDTILEEFTLQGIAKHIRDGKAKNIVVMTGAGISVAAGIPDFRSPGSGLYSQLETYDLPTPEAVFDIKYFMKKPEPFWILAKEMWPGNFPPTDVHLFIRLLADKGVLLRNFTQNIDCLERQAGIQDELLVEAHGSFATAHTLYTCKEIPIDYIKQQMDAGANPVRCPQGFLVKPDVVFFGENLPDRFHQCVMGSDFDKCDLLIVIGTSLSVYPFASLADMPNKNCPRLLINNERVGRFRFGYEGNKRDVGAIGNCQDAVNELVDAIGWAEDFEALKTQFPGRNLPGVAAPLPELKGLAVKTAEKEEAPKDEEEEEEAVKLGLKAQLLTKDEEIAALKAAIEGLKAGGAKGGKGKAKKDTAQAHNDLVTGMEAMALKKEK